MLPVYRVSYLWTASIGWLIVMVLGSAVSLVTGPDCPRRAAPAMFVPPVAALLRRGRKGRHDDDGDDDVDAAAPAAGSTVTLASRLEEKSTRL